MLTQEEIRQKVVESIGEVLNQEVDPELPLSTNLYTDLQMDSMDFASLLMLVEDDYDVQIDESAFVSITTLDQVVDLLYELQPK